MVGSSWFHCGEGFDSWVLKRGENLGLWRDGVVRCMVLTWVSLCRRQNIRVKGEVSE